MLKTSVKIFLTFILVVLVGVGTGIATYTITRKLTAETPANAIQSTSAESTPVQSMPQKSDTQRTADIPDSALEYYMVRLEGTTLGVYVAYDGKEEFLYHENVYKNDLSAEDMQMLQSGVKLLSIPELTGFMENFTS